MSRDDVKEILTKYKTVAIVELSRDPSKDSYRVAEYLKNHGFHIIPINPTTDGILGEKSYRSLLDIPVDIQKSLEIVDIFRPSAEVMPIAEQVIVLKKKYAVPYVIWMQLGIINVEAAEKARKAGLIVVMDRCMMRQHKSTFVEDDKGQTDEKQTRHIIYLNPW